MSLPTLPDPDFVERDPQAIEQACFDYWTGTLGNAPVAPSSPEAMFIRMIAYRETVARVAMNEAAKLNLLRFARFPMLDYLGELVGVTRLPAQKARTTLQITLPAVHGAPVLIAQGTRRKTKDGLIIFETEADVTIPAGQLSVTVAAVAQEAGAHGNGYVAGQVSGAVDTLPLSATATNTTTTEGGAPIETDEKYLERILLAPDAFSTAGPAEAYRFHALSVGGVVDVAVLSPSPGLIQIATLGTSGVPGSELLAAVLAKLSAEPLRPMSDTVSAIACTVVNWTLSVALTLYADADDAETLALALDAAEQYRQSRVARLGRDLVPTDIISRLKVYGVYNLTVTSPALTVVTEAQWANCTSVSVTIAGHAAEKMGDFDG